jgi:hypothetical protein
MTGLAAAGAVLMLATTARSESALPVFGPAVKLPNTDTFNEPRVAVDGNDHRWVIATEGKTSHALVFNSSDGGRTFNRVPDLPQPNPTPDVDIVTTRTGRILASELDGGATGLDIRFVTSYSDDNGKTWRQSAGMVAADTDRQWMAVGPDDPTTHLPRVYLLFHNLFTGSVVHGMFVQTSNDNGATFGNPVLVTPVTDQSFLDLQCADSGGPSSLSVNPATGRLYAVFGTRSSPAGGGCGATVTGGAEINIVRATRVWVATSPDNSPGSWRTSLAVDNSTIGKVVGLQLSYGTLDSAGNVYVAYPETTSLEDLTAAVKLVHAPADLSSWSKPITVAATADGHSLVHVVAGDPGRVGLAYFTAENDRDGEPLWYSAYAQSLDALSASPTFKEVRLAAQPVFKGPIGEMEGRCDETPGIGGVVSGFACNRFSDVYGLAMDKAGRAMVAWPGQAETPGVLSGAYVSTQTGGPTLIAAAASAQATPTLGPKQNIPATGGGGEPRLAGVLIAAVGVLALLRRRAVSRA